MIESSLLSIESLLSDKVELEYTSDKQFYPYAYPEHRFFDEYIDISEFQDLYDAGYSDELINILVERIRQKIITSPKPHNTNMIITNLITEDINSISEIIKCIQDSRDAINNNAKSKLIILSALRLQGHAHTLVIHITKSEVYIILRDPYGKNYTFEDKAKNIFDYLAKAIIEIFPNIERFNYLNTPFDFQGLHYDYSNCAPLTLYCIEQYLAFALSDEHPERFKITISSFDNLPYPKLNESLHKAFVLRLKVSHLISVDQTCNYKLGFQSAAATNYIDESRQNNAKQIMHQLIKKICESASLKYNVFISQSLHPIISSLSMEQRLKLLNLISEQIISYKIKNIINPPKLSQLLERIINNFLKPIEPIPEKVKMFMDSLVENTDTIFENSFSVGLVPSLTPVSTISRQDALWTAIKRNDLKGFHNILAIERKQLNFTGRITILLRKILNDYLAYPEHKTQAQVPFKDTNTGEIIFRPIQEVIISALLDEGADPFEKSVIHSSRVGKVSHGSSAVETAAQLPPLFTSTILKSFPNSLNLSFLTAAQYCNLELIRFIFRYKNLQIPKNVLEQAMQMAGKSLPQNDTRHPLLLINMRDPTHFEQKRTAPAKIVETKKIISEKISAHGHNDITEITAFKNIQMQLIDAVKEVNINKVVELLSQPVKIKNINMLNEEGFNALGLAMHIKAKEIAICLLKQGALLNHFNFILTPLEMAILHNDFNFLDAVLNKEPQLIYIDFDRLLSFTDRPDLLESSRWLRMQKVAIDEYRKLLSADNNQTIRLNKRKDEDKDPEAEKKDTKKAFKKVDNISATEPPSASSPVLGFTTSISTNIYNSTSQANLVAKQGIHKAATELELPSQEEIQFNYMLALSKK